ncbi:MAG: hypothetical protein IJ296_04025, partial [Bacteroidales bacterium]|nr:hypothetical protein [Bacteroidales bacterium]
IIVILSVLHFCVCLFAQGKKNVSSIVCNVVCTTDFEVSGKPGEYTIIVKKDKFVAKPRSVSVSQKNVNTTLFLDMFTR